MVSKDEIMKVLPHREPFLLIDEIEEYEKGISAIGIKRLRAEDDVFRGHFPNHPVYPGALIVEAMAQTGAFALLTEEKFQGKIVLFAGIDKMRFKKEVKPPAELKLEVRIEKIRGPIGRGSAVAFVDGELAAEGELLFAIR